jgi:hypothetical protein
VVQLRARAEAAREAFVDGDDAAVVEDPDLARPDPRPDPQPDRCAGGARRLAPATELGAEKQLAEDSVRCGPGM